MSFDQDLSQSPGGCGTQWGLRWLEDNCQDRSQRQLPETVFPPLPPGLQPLLAHFCNVTVGEARARFFLLAQVEEAKEAAIPTLPTVPQSQQGSDSCQKSICSALKD